MNSHDSEIPAIGQQVITASAFIHQSFDGKRKVFLPKRAATKKFLPDVYELPGGHIDFNEDIVTGLQREMLEEFGMTISVGDPFAVFTYTNDIKGSHSIEVIYFATFTMPLEKITIHPEDHSSYGWFSEDEIKKVAGEKRPQNDPEIAAIAKGFTLLKGEPITFGKELELILQ